MSSSRLHPKFREVMEYLEKVDKVCRSIGGEFKIDISILTEGRSGENNIETSVSNLQDVESILRQYFRTGMNMVDMTITASCIVKNGIMPITDIEELVKMLEIDGVPRLSIYWKGKRYDWNEKITLTCRLDYSTYLENNRRDTYYDYRCIVKYE